MWFVDHLPDVCSDLSAIHGIRNAEAELSGAQFFELAWRLSAYQGVIQALAMADAEKTEQPGQRSGPKSLASPEFQARDGYGAVFEYSQVPANPEVTANA